MKIARKTLTATCLSLAVLLGGSSGIRNGLADPVASTPGLILPSGLFCFRITDIQRVAGDPEGNRFIFSFEVLNWTNLEAFGVEFALNVGTRFFNVVPGNPFFATADVDSNGRPITSSDDDANFPPADGTSGTKTGQMNDGTVPFQSFSRILWEEPTGFPGNGLAARDLLGVTGADTEERTEKACNLIPGCDPDANNDGVTNDPVILNVETVDNGAPSVDGLPDNVLDGFLFDVDGFDPGDVLSVNWFLTDAAGSPIGVSGSGNQFGFGSLTLFRTNSHGPALFRRSRGVDVNGDGLPDPGANTGTSSSLRDMFVAETPEGDRFEIEFGVAVTGPFEFAEDNILDAPVNAQLVHPVTFFSGSTFVGGVETGGLARGPAFQIFSVPRVTRFALNDAFFEVSFTAGNLDADAQEEVLVGGRETGFAARGPAFQVFEYDGTLKFTRFALNPDFRDLTFAIADVASPGVLVCGVERGENLAAFRGPAFQVFDATSNLLTTRFALNPDFISDNDCLAADLDGVSGDEILVGGRESRVRERGPAFQIFDKNGNLLVTRFALNPDFTDTQFAVADVASNGVIVSGLETSGPGRGPAFQVFDGSGNLLLTRFVLNPNFSELQLFGANTNGVAGDEIVTIGIETGGLARGPAFQIWDKDGNLLVTRFVLNRDFTEAIGIAADIDNDGSEEVVIAGRETGGLARGPAIQIWDSNGNLILTRFVLNDDFFELVPFPTDHDGDGDEEIGVGGVEITGNARGPAFQIFESDGTLILTQFALNVDF